MTFQYDARYDSKLLRGIDDPASPRPWDLQSEILTHASKEKTLLDIGCGTSFKLLPLANHFQHIYALDASSSMVDASKNNFSDHGVHNASVINNHSDNLPFENNSIDIVTCMLSRWKADEIHRVLKPSGIVIIEHIGCEDKKDLKVLFGKDDNGWRGQFLDYNLEIFIEMYYHLFDTLFENVKIKNGYWHTFYTPEGLMELLRHTPCVRHFDELSDKNAVSKALRSFTTPNGVRLQQNRILIYAKNPKLSKISRFE